MDWLDLLAAKFFFLYISAKAVGPDIISCLFSFHSEMHKVGYLLKNKEERTNVFGNLEYIFTQKYIRNT